MRSFPVPAQGLSFSGTGATLTGPLLLPDGSAAEPSLAFANETTLGAARIGAGIISLTYASNERVRFYLSNDQLILSSGYGLCWSSGTSSSDAVDLILRRDAANVLALRNSTAAQAFRVYNTYTSGSVYEALSINWTSNVAKIETIQVGATNRVLALATNLGVSLALGVSSGYVWQIGDDGGFRSGGNYRFSHGSSALATNATEGFFHLQSCAGVATGVPASIPSGQIPVVIDSTNKKIGAYIGGAWVWTAALT